ncbi:MAG: FtsX-like permease family protein [Bacteroidetes bacterium]|nr:FtsX-like permease family protein [Bacteroidota bacterium]
MDIRLKIALRYIFPKGKFDFISIITIISIVGIIIGVAALIIVMSIFNGFRTTMEEVILDIDPAIRIVSNESAYFMTDSNLLEKIKSLPDIKSVHPILQTKAVIVNNSNIEVVDLISNSDGLLDEKLFIYGSNKTDSNEIVVGIALADRLLKGTIYDTMQLISMRSLRNSFNTLQLPSGIEVFSNAIIQTSIKDYDLTNCYADYKIVRQILNVSDGMISHLDIFLTNNDSKKITDLINKILIETQYATLTWIDLNKDLYSIMQMERVAVFCVISLILLIAIFNVFASLALTVMEKKQEISLLKVLGAENKMITHIYIIEGTIIGFIGTIIGLLVGVGLVLMQINFNLFEIDSSVYITSTFPMKLQIIEVVLICIFSLFLSVLAAYFPAKVATKQITNIRLYNE